MPFQTEPADFRKPRQNLPEQPETPSAMQQIGAAFQIENIAGSYLRDAGDPAMQDYDPAFDATEHLTPEEMPIASVFADANSAKDIETVRTQLSREREARRVMGEGPMPELLATTVAVLGDPTTYFGGFGALRVAGGVGTKMAATGAGVAADAALSEIALHGTQRERTLEESVYSVLLGGAFGMGIGGAAAAMTARQAISDGVQDATALSSTMTRMDPDSVGAARVEVAPEDTRLEGFVGQKVLDKMSRYNIAPVSLQLKSSELDSVRRLTDELVNTGLITQGNVKGLATAPSVEMRIKSYDSVKAGAARSAKQFHKQHKAAGGTFGFSAFREEMGRALRRGDSHADRAVADAAKWYRANVFEPLKKRAIDVGLLPEDVKVTEAISYFSRVYNREKIKARRPEFKKILADYIESSVRRELSDLEIKKAAGDASDKIDQRIEELNRSLGYDVADDAAEQVIDKILGNNAARTDFLIEPLSRGPLKSRTLHAPDELIEEFLVDDALEVSMRTITTMSADIEMTRAFGRADMEYQLTEIQNEANERIADATTEGERIRIQNEATSQSKNLQDLARILRNNYVSWGDHVGMKRIGRSIKQYNFIRLLGSSVISSIVDSGKLVMQEGMARSFGTLFADMATGFRGVRMAKKEAEAAGTALDIVLATRTRSLADLGERYIAESKFERGLSRASDYFGIVNMLSVWTDGMKAWASAMAASRILQTVEKLADGKSLSRSERLKLASSGIEEGLAKRIAAQKSHWERHGGGVLLGNTDAWDDPVAIDAFRMALLQDVERSVLTPGASDAPLWIHGSVGSLVGQFKRFSLASTTKLLASGLQTRDIATLNGVMTLMALGALGVALRDVVTNGEVKERPANEWIVNAIDRSGVLSLFVEMDAVADKFTGGYGIMNQIAGKEPQRFSTRGAAGQIFGPTIGTIDDIQRATSAAFDGELTQKDVKRFMQLGPSNLFYIRYLLEELVESTDLPEK